jgi:hypothetical protein
MVESFFVNSDQTQSVDKPISVLAAFMTGFDRVAARPLLLLPPLLLDLILWLGPRVSIAPFIEQFSAQLIPPPAAEQALQEQILALQDGLELLATRFNLLGALSSLPVGIPSLMAGTSPESAPISLFHNWSLSGPGNILLAWLLLTAIGLGFGAIYHRLLARTAAPEAELPSTLWAWSRMLLVGVLLYVGLLILTAAAFLVAGLAALLLPLLGIGVSFVALSLLFWLLVYLIFTPHGIIRYRLGVVRAMLESALLVRWNFMSTVGFLSVAVLISWLTNMVWGLAAGESWYGLLSIVGHAFISGMLITSSYAYYQNRREWLIQTREKLEIRLQAMKNDSQLSVRDEEEGDN